MIVHSFSTQYNTEQSGNLPSYFQTAITTRVLSIREEGEPATDTSLVQSTYADMSDDRNRRLL